MAVGRTLLQDALACRPRLRIGTHPLPRTTRQARPRNQNRRPARSEERQRRLRNRNSRPQRTPRTRARRAGTLSRNRPQPRSARAPHPTAQAHARLRNHARRTALQTRPPPTQPPARPRMTPLFDDQPAPPAREPLEEGAVLLRGFAL